MAKIGTIKEWHADYCEKGIVSVVTKNIHTDKIRIIIMRRMRA